MQKKVIILVVLCLLLAIPAEAQCSMCRAVLESEESGAAAKGINNGIIYLMLMPYLLVGGIGYAVYRLLKKAKTGNN